MVGAGEVELRLVGAVALMALLRITMQLHMMRNAARLTVGSPF